MLKLLFMVGVFLFLLESTNASIPGRAKRQLRQGNVLVPGYGAVTDAYTSAHYGGKTFFYFPELRKNWMQAKTFCGNLGMELPSIGSKDEIDFFGEFIKLHNTGNMGPWVASNDLYNEGYFTNVYTGNKLGSFFTSIQPDNASGIEHCAHLWYSTTRKKRSVGARVGRSLPVPIFNDLECTAAIPVACSVKYYII